jgi:hypothetical protein
MYVYQTYQHRESTVFHQPVKQVKPYPLAGGSAIAIACKTPCISRQEVHTIAEQ